MNENEKIFYEIMVKLSNSNAPLVFKGGMVVKQVLAEQDFKGVERQTVDIDANWVNEEPTMDEIEKTVNDAVKDMGLKAVQEREYGEKKAARIAVVDKAFGEKVVSIDIDVRPCGEQRKYYIGETSFNGVIPAAIIADKISVLSDDKMYRKAKDMLDVYSLASCLNVQTDEINNALKTAGRELGDFQAFDNRKEEIRHAYNKLKGIDNKPDFDKVYTFSKEFIQPFREKTPINRTWNIKRNQYIDNYSSAERVTVADKLTTQEQPQNLNLLMAQVDGKINEYREGIKELENVKKSLIQKHPQDLNSLIVQIDSKINEYKEGIKELENVKRSFVQNQPKQSLDRQLKQANQKKAEIEKNRPEGRAKPPKNRNHEL